MKMMFQDGKKRTKPGDFQTRRAILQKRQARHNLILAAAKRALVEDSWLSLNGYRLRLTHDCNNSLRFGDHYMAIIRTKSFGLRLADVCLKDAGWARLIGGDYPIIGLSKNQDVVYVAEMWRYGVRVLDWIWEG